MGIIEDKIKQELQQKVYEDLVNIYSYIDGRFELDESQKSEIIAKLNTLNSDLIEILKASKVN